MSPAKLLDELRLVLEEARARAALSALSRFSRARLSRPVPRASALTRAGRAANAGCRRLRRQALGHAHLPHAQGAGSMSHAKALVVRAARRRDRRKAPVDTPSFRFLPPLPRSTPPSLLAAVVPPSALRPAGPHWRVAAGRPFLLRLPMRLDKIQAREAHLRLPSPSPVPGRLPPRSRQPASWCAHLSA